MSLPPSQGDMLAINPLAPPLSATKPVIGSDLLFRDVYEEHFDFVWRSVRRLGVGDSAVDDVVQEIFVVVHQRLGTFEGRSSVKTWLFGVALRVVRDHRRSVVRKNPRGETTSTDG